MSIKSIRKLPARPLEKLATELGILTQQRPITSPQVDKQKNSGS